MDTPDPGPPVERGAAGRSAAGGSSAAPRSAVALPDRSAAEREYLGLVRHRLPRAARDGRWVLRLDHCFGRVLLDAAVGACWYDVLDRRRPAYRQLTDAQLATALELGHRLLAEGDPLLRALDAQSLHWRGKPPKPARRAADGGVRRAAAPPG